VECNQISKLQWARPIFFADSKSFNRLTSYEIFGRASTELYQIAMARIAGCAYFLHPFTIFQDRAIWDDPKDDWIAANRRFVVNGDVVAD